MLRFRLAGLLLVLVSACSQSDSNSDADTEQAVTLALPGGTEWLATSDERLLVRWLQLVDRIGLLRVQSLLTQGDGMVTPPWRSLMTELSERMFVVGAVAPTPAWTGRIDPAIHDVGRLWVRMAETLLLGDRRMAAGEMRNTVDALAVAVRRASEQRDLVHDMHELNIARAGFFPWLDAADARLDALIEAWALPFATNYAAHSVPRFVAMVRDMNRAMSYYHLGRWLEAGTELPRWFDAAGGESRSANDVTAMARVFSVLGLLEMLAEDAERFDRFDDAALVRTRVREIRVAMESLGGNVDVEAWLHRSLKRDSSRLSALRVAAQVALHGAGEPKLQQWTYRRLGSI